MGNNRLIALFQLEETLKTIESNHNLTQALTHVPKSLNYTSFRHLQVSGWAKTWGS